MQNFLEKNKKDINTLKDQRLLVALDSSKEEFSDILHDIFNERLEEKISHVYNLIEHEIKPNLNFNKTIGVRHD